jgi:hypothetical protein
MKTKKAHGVYNYTFEVYCGIAIPGIDISIEDNQVTCKNCLRVMKRLDSKRQPQFVSVKRY